MVHRTSRNSGNHNHDDHEAGWTLPEVQRQPASRNRPVEQPEFKRETTRTRAPRSSGFISAMLDFRFKSFIAVRFASVIYILAMIASAFVWLSLIASGVAADAAASAAVSSWSLDEGFGFRPVMTLLAIIFGWIPAVLSLIFVRLVLEFIVAGVKTAQNTSRLADAEAGA